MVVFVHPFTTLSIHCSIVSHGATLQQRTTEGAKERFLKEGLFVCTKKLLSLHCRFLSSCISQDQ